MMNLFQFQSLREHLTQQALVIVDQEVSLDSDWNSLVKIPFMDFLDRHLFQKKQVNLFFERFVILWIDHGFFYHLFLQIPEIEKGQMPFHSINYREQIGCTMFVFQNFYLSRLGDFMDPLTVLALNQGVSFLQTHPLFFDFKLSEEKKRAAH